MELQNLPLALVHEKRKVGKVHLLHVENVIYQLEFKRSNFSFFRRIIHQMLDDLRRRM